MRQCSKHLTRGVPIVIASTLALAACGGGGGPTMAAQQPARPAGAAAPVAVDAPAAAAPATAPQVGAAAPLAAPPPAAAPAARSVPAAKTARAPKAVPVAKSAKVVGAGPAGEGTSSGSAGDQVANQKIYDEKGGTTDIGVTKDSIKLGSINMHGMALGNIITGPQVRANLATVTAINDRGGILGRRLSIADCDDGPGEVSRAKACLRKLVGQDRIFSLITGIDWATASIHDDLKQDHLPYVGAWAYSHTEWQDPFMFPTHMSMVHEAMAGANWAKDVIHPKTYGLICLTSPEMQLACDAVAKILDAAGAKLVKRADVSISETSMSAYVLAMRAANPDHIIHYVINPATIAKFMVEAAQQGYWPSKGISGNHLTTEALGSLIGTFPAGRYWTNTTFRLWGSEYMATMLKYARANRGLNHHITQAGYAAINMFAEAAKQVGPNLTRDRLMAQLGNGTVWRADASLGQKFSYTPTERDGDNWSPDNVQGHEFMYQYTSSNTVSNPDGSPSGFKPAEGQFVIHSK
jgi:hypothetical protein